MNPALFLFRRRGLNILLIGIWSILIFTASSTPAESLPGAIAPYTRLLHVAEFAVLGFLACPFTGFRILPAVVACSLFAVTDELHQLFVPGRVCDAWDFAADAMGALIGATACKLWGVLGCI